MESETVSPVLAENELIELPRRTQCDGFATANDGDDLIADLNQPIVRRGGDEISLILSLYDQAGHSTMPAESSRRQIGCGPERNRPVIADGEQHATVGRERERTNAFGMPYAPPHGFAGVTAIPLEQRLTPQVSRHGDQRRRAPGGRRAEGPGRNDMVRIEFQFQFGLVRSTDDENTRSGAVGGPSGCLGIRQPPVIGSSRNLAVANTQDHGPGGKSASLIATGFAQQQAPPLVLGLHKRGISKRDADASENLRARITTGKQFVDWKHFDFISLIACDGKMSSVR